MNTYSYVYLIFFVHSASKDHFETLKAYKEMDRQDARARETNQTPDYVKTGTVNLYSPQERNTSNNESNPTQGQNNHNRNT